MVTMMNPFVISKSMEQYVLDMEPLIISNALFVVALAAGLILFFYGGGHLLDWICKKMKERRNNKKK